MTSFSCNLKVTKLQGQDEGVLASFEYAQGGGIDIDPGVFTCNITDEVAILLREGEIITMALEIPVPTSRISQELDEQAAQRAADMRELQGDKA